VTALLFAALFRFNLGAGVAISAWDVATADGPPAHSPTFPSLLQSGRKCLPPYAPSPVAGTIRTKMSRLVPPSAPYGPASPPSTAGVRAWAAGRE